MVQQFNSMDTFKMSLIVVKDNQSCEYNYIKEDMGFGWMPGTCAGSWIETYDIEEDGDNNGILHFDCYCFEGVSPLMVRRELLHFLQTIKSQFENINYKHNENLWF